MRKAFLILFLSVICFSAYSQDIMQVIPDSAGKQLFQDYIGIKLWAGDYSIKGINRNLNFKYQANPDFTMQHSMNIAGLTNMPNLGLGVEENLDKHLLVNFLNVSLGYIQHTWNWNIGCGAGYSMSLNTNRTLKLRASVNFYYEDISYSLGTYYDTTLIGFYINGVGIGTSIKNVKYVNNIFASNLCLDLVYRRSRFDFFFNASYNYVISSSEKINFYYTKTPTNLAIYDNEGNPVSGNILNLGNYIFQIGIIREFGL